MLVPSSCYSGGKTKGEGSTFLTVSFQTKQTLKKPRLFYGWVIVMSLGAVGSVIIALGGVNFGFFVSPMTEELGIRQAFFGWAQTARLVGFAISGVIIGRLLDRYGHA